jgi:hypothetical protein
MSSPQDPPDDSISGFPTPATPAGEPVAASIRPDPVAPPATVTGGLAAEPVPLAFVDEGLLATKPSTACENPVTPPPPSADPSAFETPQASALSLELKSSVPATPSAPVTAAVNLVPPAPLSQRPADANEEERLLDALISLLESGQEELRSWRAALYGSITGAFVIPIGTLAVQTTDFLMIGQVHVWKLPVNPIASSLLFFWGAGVVLLAWGFLDVLPKDSIREGEATEATLRTMMATAVLHRNKDILRSCIGIQDFLLGKAKRAARLFAGATACFLLSVAVELFGFVIKKCIN